MPRRGPPDVINRRHTQTIGRTWILLRSSLGDRYQMNNFSLMSALAVRAAQGLRGNRAATTSSCFHSSGGLVCTIAISAWYFGVVDVPWLIDQSLRNNPLTRGMPEARIQEMIDRSTRGALIGQTVVSTIIFLIILRLLEALYYTLAGKVMGVDHFHKQWFTLSCWTGLPSALAIPYQPPPLMLAGVTEPRIPQTALQPLSVNELLLHLTPDQSGYSLWSNLGLLTVAGFALAVVGVKHWSGRSWLFSTLFATLPLLRSSSA